MARQTREIKKYIATRRAQLRLKQAHERIDYDEDVIIPEVKALMNGKVKLEIESGVIEGLDLVLDEDDEESLTADDEEAFGDGE